MSMTIDDVIERFDGSIAYSTNSKEICQYIADLLKELKECRKAPEIVRCKDCIYYNWDCVDAPYGMTKTICWCDLHYDAVNDNLAVNPDDFCSRAERRTDGEKQSD